MALGKTKSAYAHRDIGEGCPHHEVEDPGLQLEDVGWRVHYPSCGQDKEEDRRKEGQEGFVQAAVFQRVTAVSSAKPQNDSKDFRAELCEIIIVDNEKLTYLRTL